MILNLNIERKIGQDAQVNCFIGGKPINDFYSFGELKENGSEFTETEIENIVKSDLQKKGYAFE